MISPFHMAAPIRDLAQTRSYYKDVLGCKVGREADTWIDFDFFGHQLSFHIKPEGLGGPEATNIVDGKEVPVRHFGVILPWQDWQDLSERLISAKTDFMIAPYIRFEGEPGEQATMFFLDPNGHALEFKSFKDPSQIFAS